MVTEWIAVHVVVCWDAPDRVADRLFLDRETRAFVFGTSELRARYSCAWHLTVAYQQQSQYVIQVAQIKKAHKSDVTEVAVRGNDCISVSTDMQLKYHDLRNMKCVNHVKAHEKEVTGVSFCADDSMLCTSSKDMVVGVWDYSTGSLQNQSRCMGHTKAVNCVFARGGCVASLGEDGDMRVWVNTRTQ